jgi:hypothetical protein
MGRRVWREPPACLLELSLAARAITATGLVPGDRDVHETLEEVPLVRFGRAPSRLERLVRCEELSRADQIEAALELDVELRGRP